tara:strand:+ start:21220 stop:23253 length:2034 start_codon:yes stop_codon:yes gene_type:complete
MVNLSDIDAEIAKREQALAIDAEIARREGVSIIQSANNPDVPGMEGEVNRSVAKPKDYSFGDVAQGVGEAALTTATGATGGALGFFGGSLSGALGELTGRLKPGEGLEEAQALAAKLTYAPKTEAGQEFVDDIGEALGSLPPVLGTPSATGLNGVSRVTPTSKSAEAAQLKSFVSKGFEPKKFKWNKSFSDAEKRTELNRALSSGDKESLSAMIDADPEFFKALNELDVKEKGLPSAASKNRQYQETEQALKKIPGSDLSKKEFNQITELQNKSDKLIESFGGTTDKSELSMRLANDSAKAIDDLNLTTEAAYKGIRDNIPKKTASKMENIGSYVKQELDDLGGDISQLSPLEKRLLSMSEKGATYHALDKIRKEVGATIGKKSDKYKSEDIGALKNIYSKLTDDQEVVANSLGMSDSWGAAKDLVKKRKALEDASINMFGKNLSDSFMPKMGLAMKKLTTGDYKKFSKLIDSVPKKQRQEVMVSALNDVFTMGSRKEKQLNIAGYADWYNGLSKNKELKQKVYQYLPAGLPKKLEALGRVTNGIRDAQSAAPIGGQVMASSSVFDQAVNGIAKRFLTKLPGVIGDIAQVGLDKGKSKNLDAALAVIGDPDFIANINALAKGQVKKAEALERKIMNKKTFKHFASTLSPKEMKSLAAIGLIEWISKSDEKEDDAGTP